ncbi:hypothetical protein VB738_00520 [Cyanobium gracile UHCC 0139]|uniref:Uncharacterized protein n=1 Tax=Cyanobium gracile UHCC 0139 TaxID=3110308 RepID=A0ABU5RPS0_9CYAN|nr:hypothetical protein [Cyanobium gracile]MEA5389730.1 hypothetical protein [Cyanobium gracile UHCC 0139]
MSGSQLPDSQPGMEQEATPDGRWQRPPLEREVPLRSGWSDGGPHVGGRRITDTVEDTIRTAYQVIGENVRQGHDAAERYSQHAPRGAAEASRDLGTLTSRMIQLGRDMANTYFDAMDILLQEVDQRRGDRERSQERRDAPEDPGVDDAGVPR